MEELIQMSKRFEEMIVSINQKQKRVKEEMNKKIKANEDYFNEEQEFFRNREDLKHIIRKKETLDTAIEILCVEYNL